VIAFYQNQGYLDATITDTTLVVDKEKHAVDITIAIDEGQLYTVDGITVFGNTVFSDSLLLTKVKLKEGDPCRRNLIHQGMLDMVSLYADHGYLEASIQPELRDNRDLHTVLIDFTIDEGRQSTVGEVDVRGLLITNRDVVTRELLFKKGDVINYTKLLKSERSLYLTGLFESVFIRPGDFGDSLGTARPIIVDIKEKKSGQFNVAAGYGSVEKASGRIEVASTNIAGTARKAAVTLSGSFIKRAVEGSFTEPWTFGTRIQTDANSSYEFVEEPGFSYTRLGARLTVGKSFGQYTRATLTYRFENVRIRHVSIDNPPEDLQPHVRSLTLAVIKDSRDNLFDPHKGTLIQWSNELAGSFLQGTNTFARTVLDMKKFVPINRHTIVCSALEVGWMDYFGGSKDIPLNERFYTGGPTSIRGFDYQRVGPLDADNDPIGGKFEVIWNVLEVRRAIYKMFGMVVFLDAGNIWSDIQAFRINDLRVSPGTGLRANTPIGIIRLDYGINVDPRDGEPHQKLYFGMGQAF
jgi:outer membrane protein insertion porin family